MPEHKALLNFIVIVRNDLQRLADYPKLLRDQIVIDLSRLQAFRTQEVATLRWQYVYEEQRWIYVLDSKKHQFFPLPLNWTLAQELTDFRQQSGQPEEGLVVQPIPTSNVPMGKPLSNVGIEKIVKDWAEKAGVFNWQHYNPTLLRAGFAAEWARQQRSLKMLQVMMRHNELSTTLHYVSKIIFWEDLETEVDSIQRIPTNRGLKKLNPLEMLENPVAKQCRKCPARFVCKHIDEAAQSEWAEGCRFYPRIIEEFLALKIKELQQQ